MAIFHFAVHFLHCSQTSTLMEPYVKVHLASVCLRRKQTTLSLMTGKILFMGKEETHLINKATNLLLV